MSSDSNYEKLSDELQNKINTELFDGNGFKDNAIRRQSHSLAACVCA